MGYNVGQVWTFGATGGAQSWTAPVCAIYKITAIGAYAGVCYPTAFDPDIGGAKQICYVNLKYKDIASIIVGCTPSSPTSTASAYPDGYGYVQNTGNYNGKDYVQTICASGGSTYMLINGTKVVHAKGGDGGYDFYAGGTGDKFGAVQTRSGSNYAINDPLVFNGTSYPASLVDSSNVSGGGSVTIELVKFSVPTSYIGSTRITGMFIGDKRITRDFIGK